MTKPELIDLIRALIIDNNINQITPYKTRAVLEEMVNSFFPTPPNSPPPQFVGFFASNENLVESVTRPYENFFGFVITVSVVRLARYTAGDWYFYDIGGGSGGGSNYTAFNQMFIWNTGDALTFNLTAGFDANYLTIDNAPLRKVTDAANTYPIEWSQSGAVATIDPSVVTDETLVDGSVVYFSGIKTI